ncbi:MarR family winged helix-turn-helix transcriptional regulator [Nocardioides daeguensis]|uniref:MarR family transcriptional regulator n=1 Tax=Nocardioides daeguensis TaxID=908359 RepID=A0ABP6UTA7_9ACTN|nr:MarR family winged helix-turn-helix transcriptional regulator [Nocardioides daeguensis]MBV6728707.1 MarR family transcriptional regulator [Nocardioides daeguensis]MCR1773683.1 MarR family transcriptional regulator [Nocardioides daeguensis]
MSTTTRWLDPEESRAWRAWLDLNNRLFARLNRELQATSGLSISDYEILVALTDDDVPEHSLRMYELGERLQWEKSRVSKQVSRMEARGLVERRHCADDRRGAFVDLTDAGQAAIDAAAPGHVALVRELFFDGLNGDQVRSLGRFATSVLDRLADD